MKSRVMILLLACGLLLAAPLGLRAQEKPKSGGIAGGGGGGRGAGSNRKFSASFKTQTEPPNAAQPFSFMGQVEADIIHRVWADQTAGTYFGYDLEIESLNEGKQFQVSIKPLSQEYARKIEADGKLKALSEGSTAALLNDRLAHFPQPQIIDDGDTVSLDVLVNRQTGVKFIDLVTISSPSRAAAEKLKAMIELSKASAERLLPPSAARDFSLADVLLTMQNHRLLINGELVDSGEEGALNRFSGGVLFFYLRGRGRFDFSIRPDAGPGFQKLGVIQNNKLSFSVGNDTYEWISSTPIVGTGGTWNLYVWHRPDYELGSQYRNSRILIGASGGLQIWRPQKD